MTIRQLGPALAAIRRRSVVAGLILVIALVLLAAGCSGEPESLVGTWASAEEGETLDFRADGFMYFTTASGEVQTLRWQADDRNLALVADGGGSKTLRYEIDDGVLTLSYPDEQPGKYTRLGSQ